MSRKAERTKRRTSRRKYIWIIGSVGVVSALLYWEQALLYVLSTLMVCALLLVVAFSDLEGRPIRIIVGVDGSEGAERAVREVGSRAWPGGT